MEQTPQPAPETQPNGHQSLGGLSDLETLIALAEMGVIPLIVDCTGQMFFDLPGHGMVSAAGYQQRETANGKLPDPNKSQSG
ncbi:MAG: hypothetical protein HYS86_04865 [Candidatus Chisholmbacteria bacterium]|nr:hypothetical protein [Candidatus Chisholmbacteria bacterium]